MRAHVANTKQRKGEQTKTLIMETAVELFLRQGYEQTTMKSIADHSDLAIGNAYYYYPSKEHLVFALYEQTYSRQWAACLPILSQERKFKDRLYGVLRAQFTALEPYHRLLSSISKFSADPNSPLSPFSAESAELRARGIEIFAQVIKECKEQIPLDLKSELPLLLWLYYMGVVFFWIHDKSFGRTRTHKLIEYTVEIISSLILLTSSPVLTPLRKTLLKLLAKLRELSSFEATIVEG